MVTDDDCGWYDDTSTTVLTYILRKAKWIEKVFVLSYLSSLTASLFLNVLFLFPSSFLFPITLLSYFMYFIFPSYLPTVPVLSFLTASPLSHLFLSLILSFFLSVSFSFCWRFREPQRVNRLTWRNQNVRFVTIWQVKFMSSNYLTSYTSGPRQDPSTASYWPLFTRTSNNRCSTLAATVHPRFPPMMALNSDSTRQEAMHV